MDISERQIKVIINLNNNYPQQKITANSLPTNQTDTPNHQHVEHKLQKNAHE